MKKYTKQQFTPDNVTELKENEVFVFGSNIGGYHGGGAARMALEHFGAIWGQGIGLQGQSYAIPTTENSVIGIVPYVEQFIEFAQSHSELIFLVTRIGCGLSGFKYTDIAPLFSKALHLPNVILPKEFVEVLECLD